MKKDIYCQIWIKRDVILQNRSEFICYEQQDLTRQEWFDFDKKKLHRLDGPTIEIVDGTKIWYIDGKLHRLEGPAIEEADGVKIWCVNGKKHRLDGPAIEWEDGTKYWYLNGKQLPTKEVEAWLKQNDIDLQTEEGQITFKLKWM